MSDTPVTASVDAVAPVADVPNGAGESVAGAEPDVVKTEAGEANGTTSTSTEAPVTDVKVESTEQAVKEETAPKSETNSSGPTNGRGFKSRNKFDPSGEQVTDDTNLIRNQTEFYFSDSNLPFDKFLFELVGGKENNPVKLSLVHSFKRMKRFQPYSAVVAALKESAYLDVVGAEGEEEIKRKIPYDPSKRDDRDPRTVYAKGFGEEQASTQFDIEAFFAPYGPVNSVRLRRYEDKGFKGSVLVEFQDLDTAKKFLELETKPLWQGKHEIAFKSFVDYKAEKNEMIREGKMEPGQTRGPRGRGGRFRGSGDRRDRDPNDWKKRRDQDQKSGFRDRRDGRGGPGRGRGNRGNGSQDRGSDRKPAESGAEDRSAPQQSNEKRPREDDGPSGEPSAKVVKTEEATPAAS